MISQLKEKIIIDNNSDLIPVFSSSNLSNEKMFSSIQYGRMFFADSSMRMTEIGGLASY